MSKPVLALDTSTAACSTAVFVNSGEIYSAFSDNSTKHTQLLLPLIDEALKKANCEIKDLEGVIATNGPGAFTGLRVGAACASALAFSHNLKLGLVSSLATLAVASPQNGKILALFDARMKQLYAGLYEKTGENLSPVKEDFLLNYENLSEFAKTEADSLIAYGEIFKTAEFNNCLIQSPKAENVFKILNLVSWQNGIEPIKLNYLRNEVVG